MLLVWKWSARLALAAMVAAAPASAQAADIYDAWINVFEPKTFQITSVVTEVNYSGGNQIDIQTIKGSSGGRNVQWRLQRSYGSSGIMASFDPSRLDNDSRNAASMIRAFKLNEAEASNFRSLNSRSGRGASIDYRGCRLLLFGFKGTGQGTSFELLIDGFDCGNKDNFSAYFEQTIQKSDRTANMAAGTAAGANPAAAAQAAPQKPLLQVNCEAATGDSGKMAAFMRGLNQDQLTRFLDGKQNCTSLSGS